jgi:hypothetical protein
VQTQLSAVTAELDATLRRNAGSASSRIASCDIGVVCVTELNDTLAVTSARASAVTSAPLATDDASTRARKKRARENADIGEDDTLVDDAAKVSERST